MIFSATEAHFLNRFNADGNIAFAGKKDYHRVAVLAVAEAFASLSAHDRYSRDTKQTLIERARPIFKRMLREKYGVLGMLIALVILEAVLSWAVQAFLSWLFSSDGVVNEGRLRLVRDSVIAWV